MSDYNISPQNHNKRNYRKFIIYRDELTMFNVQDSGYPFSYVLVLMQLFYSDVLATFNIGGSGSSFTYILLLMQLHIASWRVDDDQYTREGISFQLYISINAIRCIIVTSWRYSIHKVTTILAVIHLVLIQLYILSGRVGDVQYIR